MIRRLGLPLSNVIIPCRSFAAKAATQATGSGASDSQEALSSQLFDDAKLRVHGNGQSVEKLVVSVVNKKGTSTNVLLNKNISTPLICAKHISRQVVNNAALAQLTNESDGAVQFISLNTPLTEKCTLEFVDFDATGIQAREVNQAFWRSSTVLLGAAIKMGLKNSIVTIRENSYESGVLAADVQGLPSSWIPSQEELIDLARFARSQFINNGVPFEYLAVPGDVAAEYGYSSSLNLCRLGDFVASLSGPTIANSNQIGRFAIIKAISKGNRIRVGGVALPSQQPTSSYNWELISQNAAQNLS